MTLSHDQPSLPLASRDVGPDGRSSVSSKLPVAFLVVAAIFVASVAFYWHGFGPMGDAERYVAAALNWRDNGPFLGETHWALRHLFVLPMATIFALFGSSEFAATVPNILYAAGLVGITFVFGRKYLGAREGTIAAILIATSAFFVSRPMQIGVYGAEIFFAALASWLYVAAQYERRRIAYLVTAGAVAGLAWTIREQTLSLVVAFGLLSLLGRRQVVFSLFAIGIGFGSVLLAEWLLYGFTAGDPFYRYRIDLHHRSTGWATLDSSKDTWFAKLTRPFKDLSTDPATTPVFLIAVASAALLARGWRRVLVAKRSTLAIFAVISAVAAIISAYAFDLALPRYYPILPYFICLLLSVAIVALGQRFGKPVAVLVVTLAMFANAAGDDFGNYNEYAEARALARYALTSDEPIYTDPLTASRTRYLLRLADVPRERISALIRSEEDYPIGALYFKASPVSARLGFWCAIERLEVRPDNWTHSAIRFLKIDEALGGSIARIAAKPSPVEFVRVLPQAGADDPKSGKACLAP
ncbi:MAG: glycosyltransferase family 39 protein [Pseudomonadota bacterium]